MNISKGIKNILIGLYLSLKRFPLTIFFSVSTAVLLITISEIRPTTDTLYKIAMISAMGIPLTLCITLLFEKFTVPKAYKTAIYFCSILFLISYYYLFLKTLGMVSSTRYVAVSIALYLAFFFIPYLKDKKAFELYVITLFTGFFFTVIYTVVLFAGLSAILFACDSLLEIKLNQNIYYYTWISAVFVFGVTYFLSSIPKKNEDITTKAYPKLIKILFLYIVIPLLTAYTVILYIYFGKILITSVWPHGLVSHLVIWYSLIVIAVIFFTTPLIDKSQVAKKFIFLAPKIILPLLLMMLLSIGIRINSYGITERRYFIVILALWVFAIMLLFNFMKTTKNTLLPISLALVALLSVFGPLSSYSLSKYSQNKRFENILLQNHMLKEGNIIASTEVAEKDRLNLSSILSYFERNHSLEDIKKLPKGFAMENIKETFGFAYESPYNNNPDEYFYFTREFSGKYIDISGYDFLIDARTLSESNSKLNKDLNVNYNYETSIVKIDYKNKTVYNKDLSSFAKSLIIKYAPQGSGTYIPDEEMTLLEETEELKIKFVFLNISGSRQDYNNMYNGKGYEFYMLVKIK
jgi:hypothetical protein